MSLTGPWEAEHGTPRPAGLQGGGTRAHQEAERSRSRGRPRPQPGVVGKARQGRETA